MAAPKTAQYGTWSSPITADALTEKTAAIESVLVDAVTHDVYHIERRPSEAGRSVLVRSHDRHDEVGGGWNVRTRVHEYGGGAATVSGGIAYFSNFEDGRVYRANVEPEPVTPENANWRFADLIVFPGRPTTLICVFEDHTVPGGPASVVNSLVSIDTVTKTVRTIAEGADFYAAPAISPDGSTLSWIQWHHPDMPWEGSELMIANITEESNHVLIKGKPNLVAGRRGEVSINQPRWTPAGRLHFLSDATGFANPMYADVTTSSTPTAVFPQPVAEDFCGPAWAFGASDYAIMDTSTILYASTRGGRSVLTLADLRSSTFTSIPAPYAVISHLHALSPTRAVFLAKQDEAADVVVQVDLTVAATPKYTTIASAPGKELPHDLISVPNSITLSVGAAGAPVHLLFWPPRNPAYVGPQGERPPAIFSMHGGPTAHTSPGFDLEKQFWTSRGWAWVAVNYGGSSGYGREYRERLRGNWGIVDVNDTVEAVNQLGARGLIDTTRTAIRGGSAGGYTVLATLVSHPKVFAAGTSLYGISDLTALLKETHKFESHYLTKLIGGTFEEVPEVYKERSPITHASNIEAPLLILQGSEDAVVPPAQAELMVQSIRSKNGHVEYILFDGEGHGWRKAETIKRALEAELAFYESVFGLAKLPAAGL